MFWRLLWSVLRSSRWRLVVAMLALTGGAAVVAALLNMQADVQGKLAREFRTLGANLILQPPAMEFSGSAAAPQLLDADSVSPAKTVGIAGATMVPYLYVVAQANGRPVVVAGTWPVSALRLSPWWKLVSGDWIASDSDFSHCLVGYSAAHALGLSPGGRVTLQTHGESATLGVSGIVESGGSEDSQVLVSLRVAQRLAGEPGKISLAELSVPGGTEQIVEAQKSLAAALTGVEVRPLRQISEAQGELASRLHLLVASMVVLILLLTVLCVLATMAALAVERRRDVGLMRALGGSIQRVTSLFLAEAALLGALSGAIGYAAGIALARWMGWRVFGTAIAARWEILPLTVALMTGVALAGALPLRLLGRVRPAVILRGEE